MKRHVPEDVLQLQRILQNSLHNAFEVKIHIDREQAMQFVEFCELNGMPTFSRAFHAMLISFTSPIKELEFAKMLLRDREIRVGKLLAREYDLAIKRIAAELSISDVDLKAEIDRYKNADESAF